MSASEDPRRRSMERWQIVLIEIGLACLCGAMAFAGLLETLSCLNEGQLTEPAVCKSSSVESSYFCGLAIGAAVVYSASSWGTSGDDGEPC
jgi:hypothetical protein